MKVAYIFTEVPQIPGMFPNAELDEMKARGLPIELFILRTRPARTAEAGRIEEEFIIHRSGYVFSRGLLRDFVFSVAQHPWLFLCTLARIVRDTCRSPRILLRSLAILPKSIHFAAVARRGDFTLLHAYWASIPALGASIMSRFSGLPFTTWAHAGGDIYNNRRQTRAALRSRLREARMIVTCNQANPPYFAELVGAEIHSRLHLLTHGVDLERFHPSGVADSRRRPRLLAVSRLSIAKGYDTLLDACRILVDRGRDFECWIGGTGRLERRLHARAAELQLGETIRFLGHVDHGELPDLYRSAEIFLMPSVIGPMGARDGLPNVLLEAMASGLACVGSRIASIPEVITDGETGLLVEPGDRADLADAIERLLDDEVLRSRLASGGVAKIRDGYGRREAMDRLYTLLLSAQDDRKDRGRSHTA